MGDGVDLIPQRLRLDDEPLPRHHADLAFERQVIGVLGDGHTDAEGRGVAAAGRDLRRPGRGDDGAIARAAVLLAPMLLHVIRQLDRRDPLGVFRLAGHLGERPAARGTPALIR